MSAEVVRVMSRVSIACDVAGCSERIEVSGDEHGARGRLSVGGWVFVDGFDYCPECARLPDVAAALAQRAADFKSTASPKGGTQ